MDDAQVVDTFIDDNGCFCEVVRVGDQEVVFHYDDVPESDVTSSTASG